MSFLAGTTAIVAAALAIPALLALYFLKRRRRLMPISSTFLWRKAIQDMQVNAPFQRIRRNLLLLLQMLLLLGLLFALARPTLQQAARDGQRTVIVIDHSASMNAVDVSPSRLAAAKDEAMKIIDDLGGGAAMVISFAQQAKVVQPFTSDRARLRDAVRAIAATDQRSRIEPALRLIEPFAMEQAADRPLVVYVVSDGRVEKAGQLALRAAELRYVKVAASAANVGIVALAARRDFNEPQRVHLFARLANSGDQPVATRVTMTLDGRTFDVRGLRIDAQGDAAVNFTFDAAGDAFVGVRHDHQDNLAVDDQGYLAIAPPQRLKVLLVSDGNRALQQALCAAGVRELRSVTPAAYAIDPAMAQTVDAVVFDRWSPPELPAVGSLTLGGTLPVEGMAIREDEGEGQAVLEWRREHPLLRHVAMQNLAMARRVRLTLPDGAQAIAYSQAGPVMATVQNDGRRHVVVAFDVLESNWPMQIGFPVFITNAMDWLAVGGASDAGLAYSPGDVAVVVMPPDAKRVVYSGPTPLSTDVERGRAVLPAFERVGVYVAQTDVPSGWDQLPVNLSNANESDVRPVDVLAVGAEAGDGVSAESQAVRREVWRWFVWFALGLLMVEWIVYARRMHL